MLQNYVQNWTMSEPEGWKEELKRVAEALVFAAEDPIAASRIADVFTDVTGHDALSNADVRDVVEQLNTEYEETGRTLRIEQWAHGYRLATVAEVSPYLKAHFGRDRERRLSRSLMETLAVVAYRQPVTRPEVDFVRGVSADYALRKLMEIGLVDVVGRSDSVGRPLLYGTTDAFLEEFGLHSLDDLPTLREIEDLLDDPAFNKKRAALLKQEGLDGSPSNNGAPTTSNGTKSDS